MVKIHDMKHHNALQAYSSQQAQSKHLKANVKIGISEQGKVSGIHHGYRLTKNNKQLNRCRKVEVEPEMFL